ncbi:hypothetical protein ACFVTM_08930 [Arthrobacter sp. NPDC058130]|uniref:hypothetical protein n=1 Tax=Arthrobacter sp. NPDC058130 TaxID=3346353 RepID=UPI0036EBD080
MRAISWISFDHTVPVPVLAEGTLISRDDIKLLLTDEFNLFKWEKDGVRVQYRYDHGTIWDDAEADLLERVEVEGVEFFRIGTAPFESNDDTEQMLELGYRAAFIPGSGIVVENPDTPVTLAADRIWEDLARCFGIYAPQRLNSWDEYAGQVPNLERVFALAGVERHEKQKMALVASRVGGWLADRAQHADTTNTARADELGVGDVLEAVDVHWWSHSPQRVTYMVAAIEPAADEKLTITFVSGHDRARVLTVPADRRFLKAQQ